MTKNSISNIWESHLFEPIQNGVKKTSVQELNSLDCYIGTVLKTKVKFFTIKMDNECKIHSNYLKRFAGVEIQVLPSENESKELIIILLEDELLEIFVIFIEDIISSLSVVNRVEDALVVISKRINYWRKLFSKYTNGILTPQQQRGLYGELYFIKFLLENSKNHFNIINAWQAPMGSNQDFYFNKVAVEIKTSKSNNPKIKIANEFQLDTTGLDKLYVVFYKLIEFLDDENTLIKIINEIRFIIKNSKDLLSDFNMKIEHLGISSEMENEYNTKGFAIRQELYYDVDERFPKVTTNMVNEAISKVSYEIEPSNCKEFEVELTEMLKKII